MLQEKLNQILAKSEYVIVLAGAHWCGFCSKFKSVFEEVAMQHGSQYAFENFDVTQDAEFPKNHKISGFPTILFMKQGKEIAREMGYMSKEDFTMKIAKHFKD
ncbi:MAG: thioredoxin family protein [Chlamydiae bacterium]|nr:thioredoxin family protein [Chlamydiota bacterium]